MANWTRWVQWRHGKISSNWLSNENSLFSWKYDSTDVGADNITDADIKEEVMLHIMIDIFLFQLIWN